MLQTIRITGLQCLLGLGEPALAVGGQSGERQQIDKITDSSGLSEQIRHLESNVIAGMEQNPSPDLNFERRRIRCGQKRAMRAYAATLGQTPPTPEPVELMKPPRRQHSEVANQIQPRPRHQRRQPLQKLQRTHHNMRCTVPVRALKLEHHLTLIRSFANAGGVIYRHNPTSRYTPLRSSKPVSMLPLSRKDRLARSPLRQIECLANVG